MRRSVRLALEVPGIFRSYRLLVLLILVTALLARAAAAVAWQQRLEVGAFAFGDSDSYWILAQRLSRGETYEYAQSRMFRAPGYPLLLAGVFWCAGGEVSPIWIRLLGAVLGTAAVGGVMWLTARLFCSRAAVLAGLMAAFYPGAVGMSVLILSEMLFAPLMVGQCVLWHRAWAAPRGGRQWRAGIGAGIGAGLAGGLAALCRPSWLLFVPFAIAVSLAADRPRARAVRLGAAMLLGLVVAMGPWWLRNWQISGQFVATTTQVGASLYDGLNPHATGASDMRFVETFRARQHAADAAGTPHGLFEIRLDQRLRAAAWTWARAHPAEAARLAAVKVGRMWSPWPHAEEMQQTALRWLVCAGYVPLLLLSIAGVWQYGLARWPCVLCWLPAVYFTLLHMVFVSSIRYRQPALLLLTVLAAAALTRLLFETPLRTPAGERIPP